MMLIEESKHSENFLNNFPEEFEKISSLNPSLITLKKFSILINDKYSIKKFNVSPWYFNPDNFMKIERDRDIKICLSPQNFLKVFHSLFKTLKSLQLIQNSSSSSSQQNIQRTAKNLKCLSDRMLEEVSLKFTYTDFTPNIVQNVLKTICQFPNVSTIDLDFSYSKISPKDYAIIFKGLRTIASLKRLKLDLRSDEKRCKDSIGDFMQPFLALDKLISFEIAFENKTFQNENGNMLKFLQNQNELDVLSLEFTKCDSIEIGLSIIQQTLSNLKKLRNLKLGLIDYGKLNMKNIFSLLIEIRKLTALREIYFDFFSSKLGDYCNTSVLFFSFFEGFSLNAIGFNFGITSFFNIDCMKALTHSLSTMKNLNKLELKFYANEDINEECLKILFESIRVLPIMRLHVNFEHCEAIKGFGLKYVSQYLVENYLIQNLNLMMKSYTKKYLKKDIDEFLKILMKLDIKEYTITLNPDIFISNL